MKKLFPLIILNSVFLIINSFCFAQNRKIDSLQNVLKITKEDTIKLNTLNALSWVLLNENKDEVSLKYAREALLFANSLPMEYIKIRGKGMATAYTTIGVLFYKEGKLSESLKSHAASLKIKEAIQDKKGIANSYSNIGIIYNEQGNYPEALRIQLISLKLREELGDQALSAASYNNIGLIYLNQSNYPKALKNFYLSLKLKQEKGDKNGVAIAYTNIGNIYKNQGEYSDALTNYFTALKIFELINKKRGAAATYTNIGNLYLKLNNYEEALKNFTKSLKIETEIKEKSGIANCYYGLGELNVRLNKLTEAKMYYNKSLSLSKEIGNKFDICTDYNQLSILDSIQGNWKSAFENHQLFILYRDSLFNETNTKKTIQSQMQYDFDKKQAIAQAEQEKKDIITTAKSKKQKLILLFVFAGLFFVIVFAGFILRSLRITSKQKKIIEIKNKEAELQKKIIEEKNKDITDSIYYAKQIQDALMGENEHISMHLPEHFILFLPKDIVSGDFHWGFEKQGYWYFAAVDCTGHGVPGAVMSMLGISFLNDIVSTEQLLNPAEVLNRLRDKVINELRQTGETGGSKDGMDISLARLNLKTYELQWAGANNPLNLIQNEKRKELKADKQPIGYHPKNNPFTNHEIQLLKGDSIYIYSDGYADQFGGPKGKKFNYKQFEELIFTNYHLPMNKQKELLKERFLEWKGPLEQVDDVCVFGVRI